MASIYDLTYEKQIKRLIPPHKRKPKRIAWIRDLLTPLQWLRDQIFDIYRPDVVERTKYNAQTIVFEEILNKKFDAILKRIYIVNFYNTLIYTYFYKKSENKPVYFYKKSENKPVYLFKKSEFLIDFDFIVHCPVGLSTQDKIIRAIIDKYKIVGTNYTVIYDIV